LIAAVKSGRRRSACRRVLALRTTAPMSKPLRIGIAGLGVVGASLVRLLQRQQAALATRTGREIVVAAVSARDRTRDRGIDLNGVAFFDDPAALAGSDQIDLFVELIGGADGPA
jgi:homoserine dehydrogenase